MFSALSDSWAPVVFFLNSSPDLMACFSASKALIWRFNSAIFETLWINSMVWRYSVEIILSTLARFLSISTMFTRVFIKPSFFLSSSSTIFWMSVKKVSILFFWLAVTVFKSLFCFFSADTLASIVVLRVSLDTEASISSTWSAWMEIPLLPGMATGQEKASVASLLWSTTERAWVRTAEWG